jgi:mRNA-degrading endonuclease toxin of MazEF toxin-antitoxin module
MKRGTIVVVAARGAYTGRTRPAVVIQSDLPKARTRLGSLLGFGQASSFNILTV